MTSETKVLEGVTVRGYCPCGKTYTIVNYENNGDGGDKQIIQILAQLGKAGGCASTVMSAVSTLASLCLEYKVPPERLVKDLKGVKCSRVGPEEMSCIECIADAIMVGLNNGKDG